MSLETDSTNRQRIKSGNMIKEWLIGHFLYSFFTLRAGFKMEERLREMLKQSQRTNQDSQGHALNSEIVEQPQSSPVVETNNSSEDKKEVQEGTLNASIDAYFEQCYEHAVHKALYDLETNGEKDVLERALCNI
ncbi:hypothetical protein WA577_000226, partial [Blastocystis sp. JDR]